MGIVGWETLTALSLVAITFMPSMKELSSDTRIVGNSENKNKNCSKGTNSSKLKNCKIAIKIIKIEFTEKLE